ncbi:uncharacterized protein BP5553_02667 [Venustampulla echinocandica]|uniref:Uncharacterized protein n=1 Tax=Venustampulla echinocandica TaxID=2656787 RepID=A0A370TS12_9HELO|nr:uncharacterized protein BP5553_02667 [Venustampulla echinocandica]RDL38327.1 hypothetical protein BP5553_02667 [Venustampulla echinocandica]
MSKDSVFLHIKRQEPAAHLKILRGAHAPHTKIEDHTDKQICPSLNTSGAYMRFLERTVQVYFLFEATGWKHCRLEKKSQDQIYTMKKWGEFLAAKARGATMAIACKKSRDDERQQAMKLKPRFDKKMAHELKKRDSSICDGNSIVKELEQAEVEAGLRSQFYLEYLPSPHRNHKRQRDATQNSQHTPTTGTPEERLALARQSKREYAEIYIPASKRVLQKLQQQLEAGKERNLRRGADFMDTTLLNVAALMSKMILYDGLKPKADNHLVFYNPHASSHHTVEFTGGLKDGLSANIHIWILSQAIRRTMINGKLSRDTFEGYEPCITWQPVRSYMRRFDPSRWNRAETPDNFAEGTHLVNMSLASEEQRLRDNRDHLMGIIEPYVLNLDRQAAKAAKRRLPGEGMEAALFRQTVERKAVKAEQERRAAQAVELAASRRREKAASRRVEVKASSNKQAEGRGNLNEELARWGERDDRIKALPQNPISITHHCTPRHLGNYLVPEEPNWKVILQKAKVIVLGRH